MNVINADSGVFSPIENARTRPTAIPEVPATLHDPRRIAIVIVEFGSGGDCVLRWMGNCAALKSTGRRSGNFDPIREVSTCFSTRWNSLLRVYKECRATFAFSFLQRVARGREERGPRGELTVTVSSVLIRNLCTRAGVTGKNGEARQILSPEEAA